MDTLKHITYIFIIILLLAIILEERWPGITYVEYSYQGPFNTRNVDWGFVDYRIVYDTDISKTAFLIQSKTGYKNVVIRNLKDLKRNPLTRINRSFRDETTGI